MKQCKSVAKCLNEENTFIAIYGTVLCDQTVPTARKTSGTRSSQYIHSFLMVTFFWSMTNVFRIALESKEKTFALR